MPRFDLIDAEQAEGPVAELLAEFAARGGTPGPMTRAMANSPALLRGYMDLNRAIKRSHIDRRITERISLAVHEWLSCEYCIAAPRKRPRSSGYPRGTFASPARGPRPSRLPPRSSRSRCRS